MAIYYPQVWTTMRVVFDGLGEDDTKELILPRMQPLEATIGLNGYNLADTFSLTFDATQLPISPEFIRAIGVDIYVFQTRALELDPKRYLEDRNNLVVTGLAEEGGISYSDDGRTFHLSGHDYTALLLAKEWTKSNGIDVGSDLKEAVQGILDEFHKEHGNRGVKMEAVYASSLPVPSVDGIAEGVTRKKSAKPRRVATKKGSTKASKKRRPVPSGRKYWDVIYELCLSYGFIAYVRHSQVIIHEPQALSEEAQGAAIHYAYGHNLESLDISRKFSNQAAPQAVASFYDQKAKKFVEVRFPEKAKAKASGAGGTTVQFRRVTPPPGITDKETMKRFLSAAYHMWGRSEATLKFSTAFLRGLSRDNVPDDADANDLLRVRPGATMAFGWDSVGKGDLREKSPQQRVQALVDQRYEEQVARIVANNYDKLDAMRRPFYVKTITFRCSITDGIAVDGEVINFIDPKRDEQKAGLDVISSA